jgi:uncharacterized protein YjbI with pentapeptide repeats
MQCKYEECHEEVFKDELCIIHVYFPEDKDTEEFSEINRLKEEKVKEKVDNNDFNFEGVILINVDLSNKEIEKDLNFIKAKIMGRAIFKNSETNKVDFGNAMINLNVDFGDSTINGDLYFKNTIIYGNANFKNTDHQWRLQFLQF